MKLYHATKKENASSIEKEGLTPSESKKISHDDRLNQSCVCGFDNPQDAIDFMNYDNNTEIENIALFEFETENPVVDPEYDGNSFCVITEENIPVERSIFKN